MVDATSSKIQSLEVLYDQNDTGTPASGTTNLGTQEAAAELKLLKNEVAEIKFVEFHPPIDSSGDAENIEQLKLIIDGQAYRGGDKLILRADNDSLVMTPRSQVAQYADFEGRSGSRKPFHLGLTLPELAAMGIQSNPSLIMRNTTPKTREAGTINVEDNIGNAAITDNFRTKMYGVRYKDLSVAEYYMNAVYGGSKHVSLVDAKSGRNFNFNVSVKAALEGKNFNKLIGGNAQELNDEVEVDLFNYWARNSAASTASVDYAYSFDDSQVDLADRNMDIDADDDELYLITHLGLRPHANHLQTKIDVNGRTMFKEEIRDSVNNLAFGRITGNSVNAEPSDHEYKSLPTIDPVFISNEIGKVVVKDSGTAIGDGTNFGNGSLIVWQGYKIKAKSFIGNKATLWK